MATIADVARMAGVSTMTVSRVLNQNSYVSPEKRAAVMHAIASLNYHPNLLARSLATNKSGTIGLLLTQVENHIYAQYVSGISKHLRNIGLDVILYTADSMRSLRNGLESLLSKQVDGLIILPIELQPLPNYTFEEILGEINKRLLDIEKPTVYLGIEDLYSGNHVREAYYDGAVMAVTHLVNNGHRRIGFLNCVDASHPWLERKQGFMKVMNDHNLPINPLWMLEAKEDVVCAMDAMAKFLESCDDLPTAFFCSNDAFAVGAMNALHAARISIPDQMSIIGHDGSLFSLCSYPSLTTVAIDPHETGRAVGKLLAMLLQNKGDGKDHIMMMPPKLKKGGTVTAL